MTISKKKRIEILNCSNKCESNEAMAVMHYYNPIGRGDWFVTHVKESQEGLIFFGVVYLENFYWSEFKEKDLKNMKLAFNHRIKYNSSFSPKQVIFLIDSIRIGGDFRP